MMPTLFKLESLSRQNYAYFFGYSITGRKSVFMTYFFWVAAGQCEERKRFSLEAQAFGDNKDEQATNFTRQSYCLRGE